MRYATGIEVLQAIVHMVNPRRNMARVLSEQCLDLPARPRVAAYFHGHITASLKDATAKAARFTDLQNGKASLVCGNLFGSSGDLVGASQQLAEQLHAIMVKDGRVSGGDLAVCTYRADSHPHVPFFLALLKIDSSEAFRPQPVVDSGGTTTVDVDILDGLLPAEGVPLQKCAFVQPLGPRPAYDMILLDRQTKPESLFFIHDFLGADFVLDSARQTQLLYRGFVSAQNQLRDAQRITPTQDEAMHAAIETALAADTVNVDALINSLPLPQAERVTIGQVVERDLPDREFPVDKALGQKLVKRRRFRGDHGLKVIVEAEHYEDVVQSVTPIDDPTGPRRYEVILHTERWEEVLR